MADGRILQIFRDGKRHVPTERVQLPLGAQANLDTLSIMAGIVREDAALPDLRAFIRRVITGPGTIDDQINAAFAFCRDQISYLPEADDTETVADLWSCLYGLNEDHAVGDCAIKSVALATCLGSLKLQPTFRALQQIPGADYYNHVFVGLDRNGKFMPLDPTPPEFQPGQELPTVSYLDFVIFR